MAAPGSRDLLQLLANPTNRTILSVLALEPQYPRRLAEIVGLTEDEASRRLRTFERVGLAEGSWENVGKNVRLYRLAASQFTVKVDAQGLSVAGVAGDAPVPVGPAAEIPPALERFVGRQQELRELGEALAARRGVCVNGLGGVGKTALAAAFARSHAGPVLWHTLAPGETPTLLLGRLAASQRAFDGGERGQRLASLRSAEEERLLMTTLLQSVNELGSLVVLDRLEVAGDGCNELVADLVRRLDRGRIVLTSRTYPSGVPRDHVASLRLQGLTREDAGLLLSSFGAQASADAFTEIYDRTHGHPLSLVLVAQVADDHRDAKVERLMQESGIRDFFVDDVLPQLSDLEREFLYALSVVRHPFAAEDAEAILESKHARHTLLKLEGRGLVSRAGDSYRIHDLVRSFAAQAAPQPRQIHARVARAFKRSSAPLQVLEAIHHYVEAGANPEAAAIVKDEAAHRRFRFHHLGLGPPYGEVLEALDRDPRLPPAARGAVALELAEIETFAGEMERARGHLAAARAAIGASSTDLRVGLLQAEARLARLEGRLDETSKLYVEATAAAKASGNTARLLEIQLDRAFHEEESGPSTELPFQLYREAVALAQGSSDVRALAMAYAGLARHGIMRGNPEFLAWAKEALRLARLAGDLRAEVSVYMTLTISSMAGGDIDVGREYADRYLELSARLGDPWLRACALNEKNVLLLADRMYAAALELAEEYLKLALSLRAPFYEFGARLCKAEALMGLGRPREAATVLRPALKMLEMERWPAFASRGWLTYSNALRDLGRKREATDAEAECLKWSQRDRVDWTSVYTHLLRNPAAEPKDVLPPKLRVRPKAKRAARARRREPA